MVDSLTSGSTLTATPHRRTERSLVARMFLMGNVVSPIVPRTGNPGKARPQGTPAHEGVKDGGEYMVRVRSQAPLERVPFLYRGGKILNKPSGLG